ncbi:hypothetical protein PF005_g31653 [Phytophthora fragariae]|uniref:SET domain-containing protein n=1 Tax=Phytophthora fragariae TaxID=53985 RepID=A0A6A3V847_9STRA|nr:hypothetical protein PF003_g24845 [Phytophthora fragariae]KAE9160415.1 hypothetical protein PF005_g31653 [Phytophthora fragariae]
MQVAPLAEFQLSPPSSSIEGLPSPRSSQSTETEPSLPGTPARSAPIPDFARSPSTASSQASTVAPWSPQSPFRTRRQNRAEVVPRWYTEAVDSDSDDSETAPLVGSPLPAARPSVASSSPGFTVVEGGSANQPRDEWQLETWPDDVQFISAQLNPRRWKFPTVSVGVRGGIGCGCEERCKGSTCLNARSSRFCTEYNRTFAAECGNGLYESRALAIGRNLRTGMRGLVAKAAIPAGEVIGQYLGNMDLFGPPCINGPINDGYRMHLRTRSTGNKFVGIDALDAGGNLRFMNHACNPSARFHEVQTGQRLTVVAVTIRDVYPGEEVTVSYGNKLWFVCRCGWSGCQHRHLQQMPQDSESA